MVLKGLVGLERQIQEVATEVRGVAGLKQRVLEAVAEVGGVVGLKWGGQVLDDAVSMGETFVGGSRLELETSGSPTAMR